MRSFIMFKLTEHLLLAFIVLRKCSNGGWGGGGGSGKGVFGQFIMRN